MIKRIKPNRYALESGSLKTHSGTLPLPSNTIEARRLKLTFPDFFTAKRDYVRSNK